jgi:hypothetical protein
VKWRGGAVWIPRPLLFDVEKAESSTESFSCTLAFLSLVCLAQLISYVYILLCNLLCTVFLQRSPKWLLLACDIIYDPVFFIHHGRI